MYERSFCGFIVLRSSEVPEQIINNIIMSLIPKTGSICFETFDSTAHMCPQLPVSTWPQFNHAYYCFTRVQQTR